MGMYMLALTKLRLELGMSMFQLATAAEVSAKTVQFQENGTTQIVYPKSAKKIAEALGVGMWDVYQYDNDRTLVCKEIE